MYETYTVTITYYEPGNDLPMTTTGSSNRLANAVRAACIGIDSSWAAGVDVHERLSKNSYSLSEEKFHELLKRSSPSISSVIR